MLQLLENTAVRLSELIDYIKLRHNLIAVIFAILAFLIYATMGIGAFGAGIFLAVIPLAYIYPKIFLIILIAFKQVINGMYDIRFLGSMNILWVIGAFVPVFIISYLLINKIDISKTPYFKILIIYVIEIFVGAIITVITLPEFALAELNSILRFLNGVACFFFIPLFFKTKEDIRLYSKIWIFSASFPLLIGVYQLITGRLHFQVQGELYRIAGIYHDVSGIYFSGIIFVLMILFNEERFKGYISNWTFYLILGLVSLLVYRTYSKSGAITLAIILSLFSLFNKNRRRLISIFTAIVVFLILFTETSGVYKRIQKDIEYREKFGDRVMFTGRVGMWQRAWDIYQNYSPVAKLVGVKCTGGEHNDFLRILLDYGLIGLIIHITIFVLFFRKLLLSFIFEEDKFYKNLYFITFLSLLSFILISIGLITTFYTDFQWFHWGLWGIALTQMNKRQTVILSETKNLTK